MDHNKRYKKSNTDKSINIVDEVDNIFLQYAKKKQKFTQRDFMELREKYDDIDLANQIQKAYLIKHSYITKKAKKVVNVIKKKYGSQNLPYHYLLEKALIFKKKYKFSDAVFMAFMEIYERELLGNSSNEVLLPSTKMMDVLGYVDIKYAPNQKKISDTDYKYIQEIIKINATTKQLYSYIVQQTILYDENLVTNLLQRPYKPQNGDSNVGPLVHPVIGAIFIHKNSVVDSHFLFSNMANIVESRFNQQPLKFLADIKLFNALIRDSDDIICNSSSPYADLLSRIKIQVNLWDTVLSFRQGKFYNRPSFSSLLSELQTCNIISNDETIIMYGNTDGILLRRLLGAFSFKPTVIVSLKGHFHNSQPGPTSVASYSTNPYKQLVRPMVMNVPILNIRVPININITSLDPVSINLQDHFHTNDIVFENNMMMNRERQILYSHGVMFFHVDRRKINSYEIIKLSGLTYNSHIRYPSGLPQTIMHNYSEINDNIIVEWNPNLTISMNDIIYNLKSIIVGETIKLPKTPNQISSSINTKEVIVNSCAVVFMDDASNSASPQVLRYDPIGLNVKYNEFYREQPLKDIPENDVPDGPYGYKTLYEKYGIIYMFKCSKV
uniref:Uncharacterized protein n=1 Tax=viral metagenome TaxID=1070528 RepID=A0A6C0H7Q6_9ZZZZ